jgi:hypothetical protein
MRESGNLSSFAESLKTSALEDLRGAQAIRNELALLGQRALDELKRDHILEEAHPEKRLMPEPAGPELETQRGPVAPHQVEPDVSPGITPDVPEAIDTPPGTGERGPRRRQVTPDRPVSTKEEPQGPLQLRRPGPAIRQWRITP